MDRRPSFSSIAYPRYRSGLEERRGRRDGRGLAAGASAGGLLFCLLAAVPAVEVVDSAATSTIFCCRYRMDDTPNRCRRGSALRRASFDHVAAGADDLARHVLRVIPSFIDGLGSTAPGPIQGRRSGRGSGPLATAPASLGRAARDPPSFGPEQRSRTRAARDPRGPEAHAEAEEGGSAVAPRCGDDPR